MKWRRTIGYACTSGLLIKPNKQLRKCCMVKTKAIYPNQGVILKSLIDQTKENFTPQTNMHNYEYGASILEVR